jgi:trigger factor
MKREKVEYPEQGICLVTFSASAGELDAAAQRVYERTRAGIEIEGFAKGEADRAAIEAAKGAEYFWYDAINELMEENVPDLLAQTIEEYALDPAGPADFDLLHAAQAEGFAATARFALMPALTLGQYTGFTVHARPRPVTQAEVAHFIEQRRRALGENVPHKGPAVKGNIVHLSYIVAAGDQVLAGQQAAKREFRLGAGMLPPALEAAVLGRCAGEHFTAEVTYPAEMPDAALAGRTVTYDAHLDDVCVRQLPALNSAFAQRAGHVDTMEAYEAAVRDKLTALKRQNAEHYGRTLLFRQLTGQVAGEVPHLLTDHAYNDVLQSFQQQLVQMHKPVDQYLAEQHQTKDQLFAQLRAEAEGQVRTRLALIAIARREGLSPTDAELDAEIAASAAKRKKTPAEYLREEDRYSVCRRMCIERGADFLCAHSTILYD